METAYMQQGTSVDKVSEWDLQRCVFLDVTKTTSCASLEGPIERAQRISKAQNSLFLLLEYA